MNAIAFTSMAHRFLICFLATVLFTAAACNRPSRKDHGRIAEAYLPDSGSVAFDIEPLQAVNGSRQWMATYTSQGKTARFRIELGLATVHHRSTDFTIKTGEGRIIAEVGSDASVLLADLKKALEAKVLPSKVQRSPSIPFVFANLGEDLSQVAGGGFDGEPPGNWTALKIFLGQGEQEGEVFLNLNSVIRKGQFSIKDADYGDLVLAELAKVL